MSKAKSKPSAEPRHGVDPLLYCALSAGAIRQRTAEEIFRLERSSARRRSEPPELAKWRVIVEYRAELLKSIGLLPLHGAEHAKAVAKTKLVVARASTLVEVQARRRAADEVRKAYKAPELECIEALKELDAAIRKRHPKRAPQPDAILKTLRPTWHAMRAAEHYLREKRSNMAWQAAEISLITVTLTRGERFRERVDALIVEARTWARENNRYSTQLSIARFVVAKLAGLPIESKELS